MNQPIVLVIIAGAGGGALRGILGVAKTLVASKKVEIDWSWFLISVLISAIIGTLTASFFTDDLRLSLLAGYAGADFIEGLMKMKLTKTPS